MNRTAKRVLTYGALLQTASFLTLINGIPAEAQTEAAATPAEAPESVLVTGSLIHGAQAVGVPVSSFSAQDFQDSGALNTGDIFKNVPSVVDVQSFNIIDNGGTITENQTVNIHNLSANNGAARTELLIDGMRFPGSGNGECMIDTSVVPILAVDHVDLLADGASATYGSDAEAGVVNVILKRGFDGAITQLQYGASTDFGGASQTAASLWGRKWDTGDIDVTLETNSVNYINGSAIPSFNQNFLLSGGVDNRTLLVNSDPGTISLGKPAIVGAGPASATYTTLTSQFEPGLSFGTFAATQGTSCGNCYAIPHGTAPGTVLTWAQITANTPSVVVNGTTITQGTANIRNSFADGWATPELQTNSGVFTFDQNVVTDVQFFADGFYQNRRVTQITSTGTSAPYQTNAFLTSVPAPGNTQGIVYPYFPTGAPSNIMVNYDISLESPLHVDANELSSRYDFGLNIELPFDWLGKIHVSNSEAHTVIYTTGAINPNDMSAALGYTIAAAGNGGSFIKPAAVPYLDLFCDPTQFTCNSPTTLAYLDGYRYIFEQQIIDEIGGTFDGPVYHLPGGDIKAAVGAVYNYYDFTFEDKENYNNQSNAQITDLIFPVTRAVTAGFAQFNVPIFGGDFTAPGFEKLDLELSARYDSYNDVGSTFNPKVSATWLVADGLQFKGAWGTAFQAPSPPEEAPTGALIQGVNTLANGATNNTAACTAADITAGHATPGTPAAVFNPGCSTLSSLQFAGGITLSGGNETAAAVRPAGFELSPEKAQNLSLGVEWAPTDDIFKGLDLEATYYFVRIRNKLQGCTSQGLDSTLTNACYITPATYGETVTNGAVSQANDPLYLAAVEALLNNPKSQLPITQAPTNILWIFDGAIRNIGWQSVDGIDFQGNYSWDLGNLGAWNFGANGNYVIDNKSQLETGVPVVSIYSTVVNGSRDSGGRLRYRAHLGWAGGPDDAWAITGFMNFFPHQNSMTTTLPPECFLAGEPACDASGIPNYAQYTQQYPTLSNYVPGLYTFDLQVTYKTGDVPANDYLKNMNVTLMVTDLFDKSPAYQYVTGSPAHSFSGFPGVENRFILLTVTKSW